MIAMRHAVRSLLSFAGVTDQGPSPIVLPTCGRRELCQLFAGAGFTTGAEIGVWTGHFSKALCTALPDLRLLCVDPWTASPDYQERKNDQRRLDAAYAEAQERLRPFRCTIVRQTSKAAARGVPDRSLDFVYIDANHAHAHVLADLEAWTPKVRRGGIVSGHDFHTSAERPWIQVEGAVRDFTHHRGIAPWFVLAGEKAPSYFWVVS